MSYLQRLIYFSSLLLGRKTQLHAAPSSSVNVGALREMPDFIHSSSIRQPGTMISFVGCLFWGTNRRRGRCFLKPLIWLIFNNHQKDVFEYFCTVPLPFVVFLKLSHLKKSSFEDGNRNEVKQCIY